VDLEVSTVCVVVEGEEAMVVVEVCGVVGWVLVSTVDVDGDIVDGAVVSFWVVDVGMRLVELR
jgi:hypothetical protein